MFTRSSLILGSKPLANFQAKPTNGKTRAWRSVCRRRLAIINVTTCTRLETMNEKVQDWGDFVNRYTSHSSRHSSPERELDHGDMRLTPSPISPVYVTEEKQFCRRDNIDQCIAYLNQVGIFEWFLSSTSLHVCYDKLKLISTLAANDCSHCKLASFVDDLVQLSNR